LRVATIRSDFPQGHGPGQTGRWDRRVSLISIPAARSCAAILSRSRTRKFSIQTFGHPEYWSSQEKARKRWGLPLAANGIPFARWQERDSQVLLVPKPQRFRIFGSKEESTDPVTFSISVPPATASRTAAPQGRRGLWRTAVCAAMVSWFRPKMKSTRKQMTEFEAVGVLEKASHRPSEKSVTTRYDTCANGSGKRKDEVLGDLSAIRSYRLSLDERLGPGKSCGLN